MKLSSNANIPHFLSAVRLCEKDVVFTTKEGDVLNLKSELCRCIFAVVAAKPEILNAGEVVLANRADIGAIKPYLMDEGSD